MPAATPTATSAPRAIITTLFGPALSVSLTAFLHYLALLPAHFWGSGPSAGGWINDLWPVLYGRSEKSGRCLGVSGLCRETARRPGSRNRCSPAPRSAGADAPARLPVWLRPALPWSGNYH